MVAVGTVTPTSARFWARVEKQGRVRLLLNDGKNSVCSQLFDPAYTPESTCAVTYPDDLVDALPLRPNTAYTFEFQDEVGCLIGAGKFKTPSDCLEDVPARWTLAFLSCHQPFGPDGQVTPEAHNMLAAVRKAFALCEPDLVLFLGDQVYSDAPKSMSLFEDRKGERNVLHEAPNEVRRRFDLRYRQAWHEPAWQALHACAATACIPDDHDIIDNWGSDVEHNQPSWQKVRDAALEAAFSWQGQRSSALRPPPGNFQQEFRWHNAGVVLLDVRTQRRVGYAPEDSQIVDPVAIDRLERFLRRNASLPVIFVAVSVPMIHIPQWLSDVGHALPVGGMDLADRWSNPAWADTRDRLLTMLNEHRRAHPQQQVVLLSGDIHAGWAVKLCDPHDDVRGRPIVQFVSSAITNGEGSIVGAVSNAMLRAAQAVSGPVAGLHVQNVQGLAEATGNPFGGLNVGVVDVMTCAGQTQIRLRLFSHGEGLHAAEAVCVFDSGPL